MIWGVFLLPSRNRSMSSSDFERNMKALSEIQQPSSEQPGRWVLMPRPGARFVGRGTRSRVRARERRRRVIAVLGEAIGFTALIGAFPPLRPMWFLTGVFALFLCVYLLLLIRVRAPSQPRAVTLPRADISVLRSPSATVDARPHRRHAAAR
jgi:hypothetical protein